jgi:cytoskeletal protein RodZ
MKALVFVASASLTLLMAQTPATQPTQDNRQTSGQNSQSTQSKQSSQSMQSSSKTSNSAGQANMPAEMKTMTYKGVLVDMSCAGKSSGTASASAETTPAGSAATGSTANANTSTSANTANRSASGSTSNSGQSTSQADKSGSANRSASDSAGNCSPSANSTELGMKLDDGRTVRFDLVGNQRAQDELKNNKTWNKDLSAGKPLKVKVSGVMSGDKLIVSSIH